MTLRWQDSLLVWVGRRFPALADRFLARIYR
jgi:hypothetical protein